MSAVDEAISQLAFKLRNVANALELTASTLTTEQAISFCAAVQPAVDQLDSAIEGWCARELS